jgi:hypothetical protein
MLYVLGVPLSRTETGSLVATLLGGDDASRAIAARLAHASAEDAYALALTPEECDLLADALEETDLPGLDDLRETLARYAQSGSQRLT